MTRDFAAGVRFENTDSDRLYFLAQRGSWPEDGISYYVHSCVLKNIDFE
jgi:hypothetical protein